jgi:lipopolysaccharide transport system ATP-binding protein
MKTPFSIEVEYWNLVPDAQLHITLHLYTEHEIVAFTTGSGVDPEWVGKKQPVGLYRSICYVPGELLNAGRHRFDVLVIKDRSSLLLKYESTSSFEIVDLQERELSWYGREPGVVQPILQWTTQQLSGL